MERGFGDGAPGFEYLGFAEVGFAIGAVVLGVGEHQFVGQAVEGFAGDAEMVGFYSVVFDAEDQGSAGPSAVVGAFRGNERVADGAAVICPAGVGSIEIVIQAAIDVAIVVILIFRIQMGFFFRGRRTGLICARLLHRILILIQDVRHPTILIIESEPKSVHAIGKVLNSRHS